MTAPDFDLYPDELAKVGAVMIALQNAFEFTHFTDTNQIGRASCRERVCT